MFYSEFFFVFNSQVKKCILFKQDKNRILKVELRWNLFNSVLSFFYMEYIKSQNQTVLMQRAYYFDTEAFCTV